MFFIVGPTAVGKSDIAAEVARRCNGEIVSADAFQIYEGMPILTAKPAESVLKLAPHHLIGVVPPAEQFDVAQYLSAARRVIRDIRARQRIPIVSGGTGLYVRALTHGLAELPPASSELRARLETAPTERLVSRLQTLDPVTAARIDLKNRRRLIRAIEVCELTGQPFSMFRNQWNDRPPAIHGVLLTRAREDLHERIRCRIEAMFSAGLLEEVRRLPDLGPTAAKALGLGAVHACLRGEITEAEAGRRIIVATRQYAKRQLTWFTRDDSLETINLSERSHFESVVAHLVQRINSARLVPDV